MPPFDGSSARCGLRAPSRFPPRGIGPAGVPSRSAPAAVGRGEATGLGGRRRSASGWACAPSRLARVRPRLTGRVDLGGSRWGLCAGRSVTPWLANRPADLSQVSSLWGGNEPSPRHERRWRHKQHRAIGGGLASVRRISGDVRFASAKHDSTPRDRACSPVCPRSTLISGRRAGGVGT